MRTFHRRATRMALCAILALALMPLSGTSLAWASSDDDTNGTYQPQGAPDPGSAGLGDAAALAGGVTPGGGATAGDAATAGDTAAPGDIAPAGDTATPADTTTPGDAATDDNTPPDASTPNTPPDATTPGSATDTSQDQTSTSVDISPLTSTPADVAPLVSTPSAPSAPSTSSTPSYSLQYRGHVQSIGWQSWVTDGKTAGTTGKALRLEAFNIKLVGSGLTGTVQYRANVQGTGWQDWVSAGKTAGTTGQSLRMEAVDIKLTGALANTYDIYYRVHVQNLGWLGWASNGQDAGTSGWGYRIEALEIRLVPKGAQGPSTQNPSFNKKPMELTARAHVQRLGWQDWVSQGSTVGTTGKALRLEAFCIKLTSPDYTGSVQYRAYCAGIGWQDWVKNGATAGTTGQSRQVETVQIQLTGQMAANYDIYYRVHVANIGWLDWAKNGASAGTSNFSLRIEALQVKLVPKGGKAPGATTAPYLQVSYSSQADVAGKGWLSAVSGRGVVGTTGQSRQMEAFKIGITDASLSGDIEYDAYVQDSGWQGWVTGDSLAGAVGQDTQIQAIRVRLTGDLADYFDVYYCAHSAKWGWLDWAKNGAKAGTSTLGLRLEAFEVVIVPKALAAPGSTSFAYTDYSSGDTWLDNQICAICVAHGNNLKACFNYVTGFRYRTASLYPTGDWAVPMAKDMLVNNSGNCYRYAALFCCIAKQLGYDANVVSGSVPSVSQGKAPHGWVEIHKNGQTYVCDPCLANSYTSINWYMITYQNAPTTYYH